MDVDNIPIPSVATIKVTKGEKTAVFDTTVVQTTDNRYIYVMAIKEGNKIVNFSGTGLFREIKINFSEDKAYAWKNITISRFNENGQVYHRINTRTPGYEVQ